MQEKARIPVEFLKIWNLLALHYSMHARDVGAETMAATLRLYYELLSDIPLDLLQAATLRHMAISKWFPAASELREAAAALSATPAVSALEAWGAVLEAMAGMEYYCYVDHVNVPRFEDPITARLVESLGWRNLCGSENQVADRARFVDAYTQLVARSERERSLPAQLQAGSRAVGQLAGQVATRLTAQMAER